MPLSAISNLDLYRQNPFRITGLPVDASVKEIARLTEKLKILADLGESNQQQFAFALDPAPTVDQIRDASRCMKEPEQRLTYGFFWFWPANGSHPSGDPAMLALERGEQNKAYEIWLERESDTAEGFIATHNLAVMFHLIAHDWTHYQLNAEVNAERETKIRNYWRESLSRWTKLTSDDRIWDTVRNRIRTLDDPRIKTGWARRLASSLRQAMTRINAEAALKFAERGRLDPARMHIGLISEFEPDAAQARKVFDLVLTPKVEVIRLCLEDTKKSDPKEILTAIRRLIQEVKLHRPLFDLFYQKDAHPRTVLFDDAASACISGIVTYQKAIGDDETFVAVLREVLDFAQSAEVRERATKNIEIGLGNLALAKFKPLLEKLKNIADGAYSPKQRLASIQADIIPRFSSLVESISDASEFSNILAASLRNISLDAWNNHKDKRTAVKACKLALSFALDPEIKKRLEEDRRTLAAQKSENAGCLWIIGAIGFFWIVSLFNNNSSSGTASSTRYTAPTTYSAPSPVYSTPVPTYSTPSTSYSGNTGTYSVPNSRSAELARDREAIQVAKTQAENYSAQLDSMASAINRERIYLDRSSQYAVDMFNQKVNRYNAMLEQQKALNGRVNQMVDAYNAKLQLYGR